MTDRNHPILEIKGNTVRKRQRRKNSQNPQGAVSLNPKALKSLPSHEKNLVPAADLEKGLAVSQERSTAQEASPENALYH